jgi:hypothetical protein
VKRRARRCEEACERVLLVEAVRVARRRRGGAAGGRDGEAV